MSSSDDVRQFLDSLNESTTSPGDSVYIRSAAVTAVNRTANTYTVTIGGASIAGVPAYQSVWANVGDAVDVLFDGPAPRIMGVVGANSSARVKIGEVVISTPIAPIVFSNIPQTFKSLEAFTNCKSAMTTGPSDGLRVQLNGDTTASYSYQELVVNGTSIANSGRASLNSWPCGEMPSSQASGAYPGLSAGRFVIPDYAQTFGCKIYINHASSVLLGTGPWIFQEGGYYGANTNAITQLTFFTSNGQNFVAGSRISLYGIN